MSYYQNQQQYQQHQEQQDDSSPNYVKYGLISAGVAGVAAGGFLLYKLINKYSSVSASKMSDDTTTSAAAKSSTASTTTTPATTTAKKTSTTVSKPTSTTAATATSTSVANWKKYNDELISFKHPTSMDPIAAVHPMSGLPMIMLNQTDDFQLFIALQPSQLIPGSLVDFVRESFGPLAQMTGMELGPIEQSNINGYSAVVCKMSQPDGAAHLYSVAIMNSVVLAVIQLIQPAAAGFATNVQIVDNLVKTITFPEENA